MQTSRDTFSSGVYGHCPPSEVALLLSEIVSTGSWESPYGDPLLVDAFFTSELQFSPTYTDVFIEAWGSALSSEVQLQDRLDYGNSIQYTLWVSPLMLAVYYVIFAGMMASRRWLLLGLIRTSTRRTSPHNPRQNARLRAGRKVRTVVHNMGSTRSKEAQAVIADIHKSTSKICVCICVFSSPAFNHHCCMA